jgi:hypothetical protein
MYQFHVCVYRFPLELQQAKQTLDELSRSADTQREAQRAQHHLIDTVRGVVGVMVSNLVIH